MKDINIIRQETRDLIKQKFSEINFIEEGHKYFIGEKEYTPVSNIIKLYEPYVNWDEKAAGSARKLGKTKEEVLWDWKYNNLRSTISGTRTHTFGESYTNLMCGHPELICDDNKRQYLKEYNLIMPTYPKEEAVKKFYDEKPENLHCIGAELMLSTRYMENVKPICGTCDILFYEENLENPEESGFVLGDWKTNKSLIKYFARNKGIYMEYPFISMYDEPLSHYTIQFNLYQTMLESIGIKVIGRKLIWLKEDGNYEVINIERLDESLMNHILKDEDDDLF